MTSYRLDFCPRASWQPGVEPADQRWSRTPNTFSGTEEEATLECSDLEAAYDRSVTFRAVPLEEMPEEVEHHFCPSCGGDFRARLGTKTACDCPLALASTSGIQWVKPARAS